MLYKKILLPAACLLGMAALASCSDDDDNKIVDVPTEYTAALTQKYPDASRAHWERKAGYYVADIVDKQVEIEVWFGSGAQWAMSDHDYNKNLFYLPSVVEAAFASGDYQDWTVDDIHYYERPEDSFYEIEVEKKASPDTYLYYSTSGELLKATTNEIDVIPTTVIP